MWLMDMFLDAYAFGMLESIALVMYISFTLVNIVSIYVYGRTKENLLCLSIGIIGSLSTFDYYVTQFLYDYIILLNILNVLMTWFVTLFIFFRFLNCIPESFRKFAIASMPLSLVGMLSLTFSDLMPIPLIGAVLFLICYLPIYGLSWYCFIKIITQIRSVADRGMRMTRTLKISNGLAVVNVFGPLLLILLQTVFYEYSSIIANLFIIGILYGCLSMSDLLFAINKYTIEPSVVWLFSQNIK